MEQAHPHTQGVSTFNKKLALFSKEQTESRQVDLLGIDLDLPKVRIESQISREIRGHRIFEVVDARLPKPLCLGRRSGVEPLHSCQKVRTDAQAFGLPDLG